MLKQVRLVPKEHHWQCQCMLFEKGELFFMPRKFLTSANTWWNWTPPTWRAISQKILDQFAVHSANSSVWPFFLEVDHTMDGFLACASHWGVVWQVGHGLAGVSSRSVREWVFKAPFYLVTYVSILFVFLLRNCVRKERVTQTVLESSQVFVCLFFFLNNMWCDQKR